MASNGNATPQTQQLDKLQAVAEAAAAANSVDDFLTKAEGALQLLEVIARELGHAGGADEREIVTFAQAQRSELHAFVRKLIGRYERRSNDLRRILGKIEA